MEKEKGDEREKEEKTRIGTEGRDVANERGKDKESCANMKHERRKDFNGWVVLLSPFEVSVG